MPGDSGKFDVRSQLSGAQVVIGVDHATAVAECKRLNRESRQVDPWKNEPIGMHLGRLTKYEVVAVSGLIVGGE